MSSFISAFIDNVQKTATPYQTEEETKKHLLTVGLTSTAALVASIGLAVLGVALIVCGGVGAIIGVPLILVSIPLGYLSFNMYHASKNINDMIENFNDYQNCGIFNLAIDMQKIKNKIKQNTVCFSWVIEYGMLHAMQQKTLPCQR